MFDASILEVFVASTNDLKEERDAVEEVLRDWNARNGQQRQIILKPIRWEKDSTPELGPGPGSFQGVINKRLLDPADILIGVVGKRLGSPTATSVAGTVEEIERFAAARKPVLLYFSDRQFSLSEIDTEELQRVREFRKAMEQRGLYVTYTDIADFKQRLRSHLDSVLKDFQALLIPAGRALAYGFFKNFVDPAYKLLRGGRVDLSDCRLPNDEEELVLSFEAFRIRLAEPVSLDEATDDAAFALRKDRLAEINVKAPGMRRAFRVYVPIETKQRIESVMKENLERALNGTPVTRNVKLERLDVIDFPTPLIAVAEFVKHIEKDIIKGRDDKESAGYWQRQKVIQHEVFFRCLQERVEKEGFDTESFGYFSYRKSPDFKVPEENLQSPKCLS